MTTTQRPIRRRSTYNRFAVMVGQFKESTHRSFGYARAECRRQARVAALDAGRLRDLVCCVREGGVDGAVVFSVTVPAAQGAES